MIKILAGIDEGIKADDNQSKNRSVIFSCTDYWK